MTLTAKFTETFAFTKKFISHYQQMGAVVPSSKHLAQAMVAALPPIPSGYCIIELGAGTGVFTRQLLTDRPSNPIIAIELDHDMAERLRINCPGAVIVEGDAAKLSDILLSLNIHREQVGGILSAIPFISLPASLGDSIFTAMAEVLTLDKPYVQVTYFSPAWRRFRVWQNFSCRTIKRVWRNLPPAEVMTFYRK
jgi:phosphatidylethanolamine/phosphatidyl-N-methylethanolamine N-methyltransferase